MPIGKLTLTVEAKLTMEKTYELAVRLDKQLRRIPIVKLTVGSRQTTDKTISCQTLTSIRAKYQRTNGKLSKVSEMGRPDKLSHGYRFI